LAFLLTKEYWDRSGVMARKIDDNHFLYLNITGEPKTIQLKGKLKSILFDKKYQDSFTIAPYEPEFIEVK
jgi:beta-galactosidase